MLVTPALNNRLRVRGRARAAWTNSASPITTPSTATTDSSHDRRNDAVADSKTIRWSGIPQRRARRRDHPPLASRPAPAIPRGYAPAAVVGVH